MENSRGERGLPCFTPKSGWIAADKSPSNSVLQYDTAKVFFCASQTEGGFYDS
jgi:hypothetical protein